MQRESTNTLWEIRRHSQLACSNPRNSHVFYLRSVTRLGGTPAGGGAGHAAARGGSPHLQQRRQPRRRLAVRQAPRARHRCFRIGAALRGAVARGPGAWVGRHQQPTRLAVSSSHVGCAAPVRDQHALLHFLKPAITRPSLIQASRQLWRHST